MMRKFLYLGLALILLAAGPAYADWSTSDGHKMHFPQLPDEAGWDVNATYPVVLADDWLCSDSGWVQDIHFWGSWMHGDVGGLLGFNISIHSDIPADPPEIPYSRPGPALWEREIVINDIIVVPITTPTPEGWYDPATGQYFFSDHQTYFQYNVFLDSLDWFWQEEGTIYWLNISAVLLTPGTYWGWKSSLDHWNDDGVWAVWDVWDWVDLWEPPVFTQSLDLAFVITGGYEPVGACCYSGPGGLNSLCVETTESDCVNNYLGVYEGDGTVCGGMEACCLTDGSCIDADALCCVNELGGNPQGTGTQCTAPEACCFPTGPCQDLDPLCCVDLGGNPQGPGTLCTTPEACCMPDSSCIDLDPLCCVDLGGNPQGPGTLCTVPEACCFSDGSCLDLDPLCCADLGGTPQGPGTGCSAATIACCLPGGPCLDVDPLCCDDLGGVPSPIGAPACLGDSDGNGVDDACEGGWNPGDPYKMHFPQLPDEAGWDVNATNPLVLADDWRCTETGWVEDIHFWGSWMGGVEGQILSFTLSIHADIPADPPAVPYSRPGETLWERTITNFGAVPKDPPTLEGWYDPSINLVLPSDHQAYFQYNVILDSLDWFWQEKDTIYWLNISATVANPSMTQWGWKSSLNRWNDDAVWAYWTELFWIDMWEPPYFDSSLNLAFVITGEPQEIDTCTYYKDPYNDYAPVGMPDFDQKQDAWTSPFTGNWSWCGPVALGDCIWWFDSKFEDPTSPPPPTISDSYPLIDNFGNPWDDHDPSNVMPFIQALAPLCNTDVIWPGTILWDLEDGFNTWVANQGLGGSYSTYVALGPEWEEVRDSILSCQDVILLLGFYELLPTDPFCQWIGGHYVTSAGVCVEDTAVCVSDPMFDANEGEPPAGGAHGAAVHNDAALVSGPHGSIHHDLYHLMPYQGPCPSPATWMFTDYPNNWADVMVFENENPINPPPDPVTYFGGQIIVLLDAALIICPILEEPEACCLTDGQCIMVTPSVCLSQGGTPQGSGTTCQGVEACCLPDGSCIDVDALCCVTMFNGVPQGPGTQCSTPEACCLETGGCIDVDPLCCDEFGGVPQGPGTTCTTPRACCLPDGECVMIDPLCCDDIGGVPQPAGFVCSAPEACCLPDGQCVMADPVCCDDLGGVPQGSGTTCTAPEACCLPDSQCVMADPLCCDDLGGVPQGSGTSCTTPQACCLSSGECVMTDPLCCDDLGGVPQGPGTSCTAPEACCLSDGQCVMADPVCCDDLGGTPQGSGTQCTAVEACCFTDGSCQDLDPLCCVDLGGTPQGSGTQCGNVQACCFTDGSCLDLDSLCCEMLGGIPQGAGTVCLGDGNGNGIDDACEEEPYRGDDLHGVNPDYNDGPLAPMAWHQDQRFEWLGKLVDKEAAPAFDDNTVGLTNDDDGLLSVSIDVAAGQVTVRFKVSTNFTALPGAFPVGSNEYVDAWIDWNHNATFEHPAEHIGTWSSDPNIGWPAPDGPDAVVGAITGPSAGPAGDYAVRLRLDWHNDNLGPPHVAAPGGNADGDVANYGVSFGEDEDYWSVYLWEHKMHYPQLPDELGWDVDATFPLVLADDWKCSETGFVEDIHFWGSWLYDVEGQITSFNLSIHADIPADPPLIPYSRPGDLLWQAEIVDFEAIPIVSGVWEGWYNPETEEFLAFNHQSYFQYNILLPESMWFEQTEGTIYWLDISANLVDPLNTRWGWKSSVDHWNDDAVWRLMTVPPTPWIDMFEPPDFDRSLDLAFVITGGAVCDCIPGDADGNTILNISDAVYLITYIFGGGPAPVPYAVCNGDADCNCIVNISDAVFMITYIFGGGPAPCTCEEWLAACGPPLY